MAGTTIIGRVAVKVYPDTSKFHEELKKQLEKEERRAKLEVPVTVDEAHSKEELKVVEKKLDTEAKAHPVKIDVKINNPDITPVKDALKDVEVKVKVDTKQATRGLKKLDHVVHDVTESARQLDGVDIGIFDPATMDSFKSASKIISDMQQGIASFREEVRRTGAVEDSIARQNEAHAKKTQANLDDVAKKAKRILAVEKNIAKQNEDSTKSLKDQADAAKKLEDSIFAAGRDISKIQFDQQFKHDAKKVDGLLNEIEHEISRIDAMDHIEVKLEWAGMTEFQRERRIIQDDIDSLNAKITPSLGPAEKRKVLREIDRLRKKMEDQLDDVDAKIKPNLAAVPKKVVQIGLAILTRPRKIELSPELNNRAVVKVVTAIAALSGARLSFHIVEDLAEFVGGIDKALPKIATLSSLTLTLAGYLLSASSNIFSLGAGLASIFPAALGLPGLLAGAGIGIGIMAIALKDMKKRLPGFQKGWDGIKKTIRDNFWEQAINPMRRMGKVLLPQITKGFELASTQVGKFFGKFSDSLTVRLGGALVPMFKDLGDSIEIFSKHTDDFANIIVILGEQGAKLLPRLAKYFGDALGVFSDFLTKAEKDGSLTRWIETGIKALRDLGGVIKGLGGIFYGLGVAAQKAGGTSLGQLADKLQHISDIINGAHFQELLVNVLKAAGNAMDNLAAKAGPGVTKMFEVLSGTLATILPKLGTTVGTALGAIGDALARPAFQKGVIAFFDGISAAVDTLVPVLAPLSDAFGAFLSVLGGAIKDVAPVLGVVLGTLAKVFTILGPEITIVAEALSGGFLTVLEALAPVIVTVAKAVAPLLRIFGKELGDMMRQSAPAIAEMAQVLGGLLVQAMITIIPLILSLVRESGPVFVDLFLKIADALLKALPLLIAVGDQLGKAILDAILAIIPYLPDIVQGFLDLVNALIPLIPQIVALIPQVVALVPQIVALVPQVILLVQQVILLLPTLITIVMFLLPKIISFLSSTVTSMTNFSAFWQRQDWTMGLGSLFAWISRQKPLVSDADRAHLKEMGKDVLRGIAYGLGLDPKHNLFDDAMGKIKDAIVGGFKRLFGIHSPSMVMAQLGGYLIAGLIQGISNVPGNLFGVFKSSVITAFSTAGTWLKTAGHNIMVGLQNGIVEAFGDVQRLLARLTSYLPDWKGPPSRDKTLLVDAGQSIMQGLVAGMEDGFGGVKSFLGDVTKEIEGTKIGGPTVAMTGASALASQTVGSSLRGAADTLPAAGSAPLVGALTFQSSGDQQKDLEEAMFELRRLQRGGRYGY